jgi:hypothetical protein
MHNAEEEDKQCPIANANANAQCTVHNVTMRNAQDLAIMHSVCSN